MIRRPPISTRTDTLCPYTARCRSHGPDSQVLLLSGSAGLLDAVEAQLQAQLPELPRADIARDALAASRLIQVVALATAFEISNRYAPEHLILALRASRAWLDRVQAAGSVFLGDWTPEALRSEEPTSELQSLMRISYADFRLRQKPPTP